MISIITEAAKRPVVPYSTSSVCSWLSSAIRRRNTSGKRRLTLAARELTSTDAKVIDIALKYGYDSPDSFTRAFRNVHGITPQAARAPGVKLTAFPRISFNIILKGGNDMDYRIIEKPAFDILGRSRKFRTANGENFIKIPQFWHEFMETDEYKTLWRPDGKETRGGHRRSDAGRLLWREKTLTGTRFPTASALKNRLKNPRLSSRLFRFRRLPGRCLTALWIICRTSPSASLANGSPPPAMSMPQRRKLRSIYRAILPIRL